MILTRTRWKRVAVIAALGVMALLPDRVRPVRVAQPRQRPPLSDPYAKPAAGAAVDLVDGPGVARGDDQVAVIVDRDGIDVEAFERAV